MKKKGFTLIELLAVIVILAIIALIATPLVLKYIEKSSSESKVDSAYSFVRNLETEIANFSIKHKGTKYNKTGLQDIKDLDGLNTTVKGENPDDGKVCISSLGQIEKGVFKYNEGKYYVLYDGKKGSISDEDTYNNFSCSNSGNSTDTAVIDEELVTFECYEDEGCLGILNVDVEDIKSKVNAPGEYKLIIKNKDTKEVLVSDYLLICYDDTDLFIYGEQTSNAAKQYIMFEEDFTGIIIESEYMQKLTSGEHIVNIIPSDREFVRNTFKIDARGTSWLMGFDIVPDIPANVSIIREDGSEYCNKTVEFLDWGYAAFMSYGDYDDYGELPEVYNDIANGKIVTVKVTQNIDGVDVVTTIVGNNPVLQKGMSPMHSNVDVYSIGSNLFMAGA